MGWTGLCERRSHFFHSDCAVSLSLWDLNGSDSVRNLDGHLEPQEWNPRECKRASIQCSMAELPGSFALAWSRGPACCKWISESSIAKDLEMAPSLWVVWSAGAAFPATAEVTQPEPWWSPPDVCLAQPHSGPGLTVTLCLVRAGQGQDRQGQILQTSALSLWKSWWGLHILVSESQSAHGSSDSKITNQSSRAGGPRPKRPVSPAPSFRVKNWRTREAECLALGSTADIEAELRQKPSSRAS